MSSCAKQFTLHVAASEAMPFDQALYVAGAHDKIFAVRGGSLFKCNATTGAIEASAITVPLMVCTGSLAYHAGSDRLLVAGWYALNINQFGQSARNDIFRVNPSTLATVGGTVLGTAGEHTNHYEPAFGYRALLCQGDWLGWVGQSRSMFFGTRNLQTNATWNDGLGNGYQGAADMGYDDALGKFLLLDVEDWEVSRFDPTDSITGYDYVTGPASWHSDGVNTPLGLCYEPNNDRYYVVVGTQTIHWYSKSGGTWGTFNLGRADARPFRIKYNSVDHQLYVPCHTDNTVCVFDPDDHATITVKTGFDNPIDVVFTPTKTFAVQAGATGLREVT